MNSIRYFLSGDIVFLVPGENDLPMKRCNVTLTIQETGNRYDNVLFVECVNSTSLSLCLCLHTEFSLCLCHSVYHHKWADAQFFMADA